MLGHDVARVRVTMWQCVLFVFVSLHGMQEGRSGKLIIEEGYEERRWSWLMT